MPAHHTHPQWLIQATESASYIDDAWSILAIREQQRSLLRAASRPSKVQRISRPSPNIDPAFLSHYSVSNGTSSSNKFLNRYFDVVPYDRNRFVFPGSPDRYLNASWVQTRASGQWFIATQAPLPWTANSLLSLTTLSNVSPPESKGPGHQIRTIVQLTPEYEGGMRKADQYFPSQVGESCTLRAEDSASSQALEVQLTNRRLHAEMDCVESQLSIRRVDSKGDEVFTAAVTHLLYTAWPDHGIPQNAGSLLRFIHFAQEANGRHEEDLGNTPPMVVGCSAGIGRTGSFIAICSLLGGAGAKKRDRKAQDETTTRGMVLPNTPGLESYSEDLVVTEIDWLREQRGGMVQKREQMELIYRALDLSTSSH